VSEGREREGGGEEKREREEAPPRGRSSRREPALYRRQRYAGSFVLAPAFVPGRRCTAQSAACLRSEPRQADKGTKQLRDTLAAGRPVQPPSKQSRYAPCSKDRSTDLRTLADRVRRRRGGRAHGPRPSQVGALALARLALSLSLSARALDAFRRQHVPADKDTTQAPSRLVRDPELEGPDAADRATEPACERLQREAEGTRRLASASLIE